MVCALSGTDGTGALAEKSAAKALVWMESQKGGYPKLRMADFNDSVGLASRSGVKNFGANAVLGLRRTV